MPTVPDTTRMRLATNAGKQHSRANAALVELRAKINLIGLRGTDHAEVKRQALAAIRNVEEAMHECRHIIARLPE
jgi:hypothetical protein